MKHMLSLFLCLAAMTATAQVQLTVDADKVQCAVSPTLYGLMTEEINYCYEGGLYSQLIRDPQMRETRPDGRRRRGPQDDNRPKHWIWNDSTATWTNTGYWGIAVRPETVYRGKMEAAGNAVISVGLRSTKDGRVFAQDLVKTGGKKGWYDFTLRTTPTVEATKDAEFFLHYVDTGRCRLSYVSLTPVSKKQVTVKSDLYRTDLMDMLREMHPKFLRFPGGNYLEGNRFSERYWWQRTLGPVEKRPGHQCCWGYWSTDGMGLLEFLCWCEEMGAEPILGVFAGYVLSGDYVTGKALDGFIEEALDEIEYVIGDASTEWGARRVADGHPEPFPLHYVEVGNEDFFDRSGSYAERYTRFYEAIKAKYPQLDVISTEMPDKMKRLARDWKMEERMKLDIIDEHYYRGFKDMLRQCHMYDKYDRKGPKVFCGEWATREGDPTTNMMAALGDAAWMVGMERNSDVVIAQCYAPLFVNVNPGGMQWKSDLIGYDALNAYGSPSYYAQCMFAGNIGTEVVETVCDSVPRMKLDDAVVDQFYCVATRDKAAHKLYLKMVNAGETPLKVRLNFKGEKLAAKAVQTVLTADSMNATNSITDPKAVVPQTKTVKIGRKTTLTLPARSIHVLAL